MRKQHARPTVGHVALDNRWVIPEIGFFEASANVIPVLYLAVLVEYRLLARSPIKFPLDPPKIRVISAAAGLLACGVVFIGGEVAALVVLASGEPSLDAATWVVLSLIVATFFLIGPLVMRMLVALHPFRYPALVMSVLVGIPIGGVWALLRAILWS